MFAYCLNNPACRVEIGGYASEEADLDDETKDELFHQPKGGVIQQSAHPNGLYESAPYHTPRGNSIKSPSPTNGQEALDNSVQVKSTSPTRIGISNNQFVVLMQHRPGLYHGHVREWGELTQDMQNALIRNGFVSWKGRFL